MKGHTALQKGMAKANNALRGVFFSPDLVMTLLKPAEDENEYEALLELQDSWFFKWDRFSQSFRFEISRDDDQLTDAMDAATHIAVDNDIYRISDGDTVPPVGVDVMWRIYAERFDGSRHFTVLR